MDKLLPRGVGVIVTNDKRTHFYLQQKDDSYHIEEYRLHYTLFGGAIEEGESEESALSREIEEELGENVVRVLLKNVRRIEDHDFINVLGQKYNFTLYEAIVSNDYLKFLPNVKVMEGKGGFLFSRKEIEKVPLFRKLKPFFQRYLSTI
ncbi:MAG: NUDIX hydrolase [Nanoarchaeota archaeon]|nr:NUDIX hydrolase [Nanoarchaeota archaeon]